MTDTLLTRTDRDHMAKPWQPAWDMLNQLTGDATFVEVFAQAPDLLEFSRAELVWPMLMHRADPSLRTELIHIMADYDVDPRVLIERLKVEKRSSSAPARTGDNSPEPVGGRASRHRYFGSSPSACKSVAWRSATPRNPARRHCLNGCRRACASILPARRFCRLPSS